MRSSSLRSNASIRGVIFESHSCSSGGFFQHNRVGVGSPTALWLDQAAESANHRWCNVVSATTWLKLPMEHVWRFAIRSCNTMCCLARFVVQRRVVQELGRFG